MGRHGRYTSILSAIISVTVTLYFNITQYTKVHKQAQVKKIVGKQLTTLNFQLTFQLTIFENQLPTKSLTGLFQLKIVKSLTTFFQFSAHHWLSYYYYYYYYHFYYTNTSNALSTHSKKVLKGRIPKLIVTVTVIIIIIIIMSQNQQC